MQGRERSDDELAQRRAARRRPHRSDEPLSDEDLPPFSWSETFAMIIAAYQVLFPMLFVMVGVMAAAFLLFRFIFR